jgi:hypothetical protein
MMHGMEWHHDSEITRAGPTLPSFDCALQQSAADEMLTLPPQSTSPSCRIQTPHLLPALLSAHLPASHHLLSFHHTSMGRLLYLYSLALPCPF